MEKPLVTEETIHATCVALDGRGVLLAGPSGSGKSDLALRLIDRGAVLVSDDYTICRGQAGVLTAFPPATIAGQIEVRGLGIIPITHAAHAPVALLVELTDEVERMAEARTRTVAGIALRLVRLAALEASAPVKVALALGQMVQ